MMLMKWHVSNNGEDSYHQPLIRVSVQEYILMRNSLWLGWQCHDPSVRISIFLSLFLSLSHTLSLFLSMFLSLSHQPTLSLSLSVSCLRFDRSSFFILFSDPFQLDYLMYEIVPISIPFASDTFLLVSSLIFLFFLYIYSSLHTHFLDHFVPSIVENIIKSDNYILLSTFLFLRWLRCEGCGCHSRSRNFYFWVRASRPIHDIRWLSIFLISYVETLRLYSANFS